MQLLLATAEFILDSREIAISFLGLGVAAVVGKLLSLEQ